MGNESGRGEHPWSYSVADTDIFLSGLELPTFYVNNWLDFIFFTTEAHNLQLLEILKHCFSDIIYI